MRPKISTRDTCLCKEHTNIKFLIIKLSYLKLINARNTTSFLNLAGCEILTPACLDQSCVLCKNFRIDIPQDQVEKIIFYEEWVTESRSREGSGGKIFNVTLTTKKKVFCTVQELVDTFFQKLPQFLRHVYLVTHQYDSSRKFLENLDFKEIILGFDFSTNYLGKCREDIQSCNYGASKQQISIQTGIAYYGNPSGLVEHVGFGTVCDFLQHDAAAAWAYLEPVLKYIMELVPDVEVMHTWSDGPTSQYKNKRFPYLLKHFCKKLKLEKLTHNYNPFGHDKVPWNAEG